MRLRVHFSINQSQISMLIKVINDNFLFISFAILNLFKLIENNNKQCLYLYSLHSNWNYIQN